MKNYIDEVNGDEFTARFNRSNLSFKYKIVGIEKIQNVKMQPAICLLLSPSGYDDPRCFVNGEFDPSKIRSSSQFPVEVTDFEVIGNLTNAQKRELLKTMHENKPYTEEYYSAYRNYHKTKLNRELSTKLKIMQKFEASLIKSKGKKYFDQLVQSTKEEYRTRQEENQFAFTQWEKV